MKKIFVLCGLALLVALQSFACDICGCGSVSSYSGILPTYQSNFVGMRYQYRFYKSYNMPELYTRETSLMAVNYYHSYEMVARVYPFKRVQLMGFIPYNSFRTVEGKEVTHFRSIGDVSVLANYVIINTGDSISQFTRQSLTAGGGVKLPTGEFGNVGIDSLLIPGMQTGTGSIDYLINVNYTVRQRKIGFSADANARINGTNKFDYHFGNRLSGSLKAFYWMNEKKFTVLPSAGVSADYAVKDFSSGFVRTYTGGHVVNFNVGTDIFIKKIVFGATCSLPVTQNLSGGLVKVGPSFSLHLQYLFDL